MNAQKLFHLKGINVWSLVIAISLNTLWTLAVTLSIAMIFARASQVGVTVVQMLLLGACFAGPFLIGWLAGALARDWRRPTYGFYGSLGSVGVLALVVLPSGLLALMMIVAAITGGLNGGMLSLRRRFPQKP